MMPPGLTTTATQDTSSRMVRKVKPKIDMLEPAAMTQVRTGASPVIGMRAMQRQAKFGKRRKF